MRRRAVSLAFAVLLSACGGGDAPEAAETLSPEAAAFRTLGMKGADETVRITYAVTSGEDRSEVVVSQQPPRRSFRVTQGETSLIIATEGGDVITCGKDECFRIPGLGSSLGAAGAAVLGPLAEGFDMFHAVRTMNAFTRGESRMIAGRESACGTWKPDFSPEGFTMCLDAKTGVPLFYDIASGNITVALEATTIDRPEASDFEPPFEVTDLPTGYAPPT